MPRLWWLSVLIACGPEPNASPPAAAPAARAPDVSEAPPCRYVESGYGPQGTVALRTETVVDGLEVPWGLAFLPDGDLLVTERAGRVRRVSNGRLVAQPVADVQAAVARGEGGLLDLVLDPDFATNRRFYLYLTATDGNRVERWILSRDGLSAERERILFAGIPSARFHNGGRMGFGPDGMLYVATGDGQQPRRSQDPDDPAGALLRIDADGEAPPDNPFDGPVFVTGIRNSQGFDWDEAGQLYVTDHGPSGELGRRGHDEVHLAAAGSNLGWPDRRACDARAGMEPPLVVWREAVPPGGAAIYRGDAIPEWRGDLIVGVLGAEHLQRIALGGPPGEPVQHEVYLRGELGRIRTVRMGPDGELYVTTSNCDGRGTCPPGRDRVVRITR